MRRLVAVTPRFAARRVVPCGIALLLLMLLLSAATTNAFLSFVRRTTTTTTTKTTVRAAAAKDGLPRRTIAAAAVAARRTAAASASNDDTNNNISEGSSRTRSSSAKPQRPRRKATRKNNRRKPGNEQSITEAGPQTWRVFGVEVHPDDLVERTVDDEDGGNEHEFLHPAILQALQARLRTAATTTPIAARQVRLVRRSLDARHSRRRRADGGTGPRFVYVLDVTVPTASVVTRTWRHQPGRLERLLASETSLQEKFSKSMTTADSKNDDDDNSNNNKSTKRRVVVVGAGPAGLFCALQLAKSGHVTPIVVERGQPVEVRGRDIGALVHRHAMNADSNFAFGEGGAGTWSDGKLTTRIGRNSERVRTVLETLVEYGAPETILVDGAPHLGTDNLVRLLRNLRRDLRALGGEIRFGTKVTGLRIDQENGVARGVDYTVRRQTVERNMSPMEQQQKQSSQEETSSSGTIIADAVVLATGHSARDVYEQLHASGVALEAKGFAVGFRVEHPQKLINQIQYGTEWRPSVVTGKVTTDALNLEYEPLVDANDGEEAESLHHKGKLPVPSYRLATDQAFDGVRPRGAYSFCMCPGGQIVPASTDPDEVCVNGMSFSRRDSPWANSALVVTVAPDDAILEPYREEHGVLAGVAFQRDMERRAAVMGGGNLTVPVQRLTDFCAGRPSTTAPSSSYRLGTKAAACHEIYPPPLVAALRNALVEHFDANMPGFVCDEGLLHGVETRTSSPVRVARDRETFQAEGCRNLFPAGEGAGFAGGIVSAAVDGMAVAESVLACLGAVDAGGRKAKKKIQGGGIGMFY